MNDENKIENENQEILNLGNKSTSKKIFDLNKILSSIAIILSVTVLSIYVKDEYFKPVKQVFFVDNASLRAMYQNQIQKDILALKIQEEKDVTSAIVNFDTELENTLDTLTKDYGITIYASRAYYTPDEKIDLTAKVAEILEKKGYKIK